jgi:hypothetical protein
MQSENDEKLRQFNQEWDKAHSTDDTKPPIDLGGSGASNLAESIAQQPIAPTQGVYTPANIPTTGNQCPQCNLLHPPLRPGETCPNAPGASGPVKEVITTPPAAVQSPTVVTPAGEVIVTPAAPAPDTETVSESTPLADNNIPTEIHVNKYLASWGDQIQAHCKENKIENVKKLMRHITIEITDFLENYKGK